jgi:hypothetical protein
MWFLKLRLRFLMLWFRATAWIYTPLGHSKTRQQPIDDMIEVLSGQPTDTRTTATKATWTATYVVLKDQDTLGQATSKATKQPDKLKTKPKTAGQSIGNIPTWMATFDNTTTKATFARATLDNMPEATANEATQLWATLGHEKATFKSFQATLSRMRKT